MKLWCCFAILLAASSGAEPPKAGPEDVIIAVIGTGVDAHQPDLKEALLPGRSVGKDADAGKDEGGSGTRAAKAILDLVRSRKETGQVGRILILSVRATGEGSVMAAPDDVAHAVEESVEAGARVVCITLMGARGSRRLDDALATADRKGVLVFAAAGAGRETLDMQPAACPSVFSCTRIEGPEPRLAPDACASGKTAFAGEDMPEARAAAVAALLLRARPDLNVHQTREWLRFHGPRAVADDHDWPFRSIAPQALDRLPRTPEVFADLAIEDAWLESGVACPGEEGVVIALIRNTGLAPASGVLGCRMDGGKPFTVEFEAVPPGSSTAVRVSLPAADEGRHSVALLIECREDANPSNAACELSIHSSTKPCDPLVRRVHVRGLSHESGKAVVEGEVVNTSGEKRMLEVTVRFADAAFSRTVTLEPHQVSAVALDIEVPDPKDRWSETPLLLFLNENGRQLSFDGALLRVDFGPFRP